MEKLAIKDLLEGVGGYELKGDDLQLVEGIAIDSRKVKKEFAFIAFKGSSSDGNEFVSSAIKNGAHVIVSEMWPELLEKDVIYVKVKDGRKAAGVIADNFYDRPSLKLKCIGITGTNGKTSIATLLYSLFKEMGYRVGLISTIEILVNEEKWKTELTTPDVVSLHKVTRQMVDEGCSHVFMEVSSHAIDQNRIAGLRFDGGVFTNITHDHLDYHGDFKSYVKVKQSFFSELSQDSFALTNEDDKNGLVMTQNTKARRLGYSARVLTDYKLKVLSEEKIGMHLEVNGHKFLTRLAGRYNAYNLTAVYAVARELLDIEEDVLIEKLSGLYGAKGRMEIVSMTPRVIVDYAHTPDALKNVLETLKASKGNGRLICVVGCGGDRDRLKRPEMARISLQESDMVIITSDNPRSEDPQIILDDMREGVDGDDISRMLEIVDRKAAIKTAVALSKKEDTILIAGKGHEEYQEVNGVKHFFSDQQIVKDILSKDI